ncbi:MAG: LCP family protein, partial [bacterium]
MNRSLLLEFLRFCLFTLALSLGLCTLSFLYDAWQKPEFVRRRPLVVLFVGTDSPGTAARGRADSITLAFLDFRKSTLALLSVPRDAYTDVVGAGFTRINASYAKGGVPLLTDTLQRLLARRIDRFLVLDFKAFEKAADLVGGVDITVDKDLDYEDRAQGLVIHIKKGRQHMDGHTALMFARFRMDRGGDMDRIRNQQKLIRTLAAQTLDLHNLYRLPGWYRQLRPYVQTNVDPQDLYIFISLFSMNPEAMVLKTLPGSFASPYW